MVKIINIKVESGIDTTRYPKKFNFMREDYLVNCVFVESTETEKRLAAIEKAHSEIAEACRQLLNDKSDGLV